MSKTSHSPGFEEIQHEQLSRLFGWVTHVRLALLPLVIGLVVWVLVRPVTPWRRNMLVVLGLASMILFIHEVIHHRRHGLGRRAFAINLGFAAAGQAAVSLATGGLESPFLFAMFPLAMVNAVLVEAPALFFVVQVQLAGIWAMAWTEHSVLLPGFIPPILSDGQARAWSSAHLFWNATFATIGLAVATSIGRGIRHAFDLMIRRAMTAREELLRAHADRAHELAALSGEIAHELKNPLASIKGLSALLAQDAPPGKPAERLDVLRREVDRMQGILEEFLNFSRPVVPLSVATVDIETLLREVVDMHEGMARERNVVIVLRPHPMRLRCDPRKIKQAIINLMQNALEASPRNGRVEIEADEGSCVCVRILDRGPGVADGLADKVFEPGVTTKAQGSGLGLTIARALARQHNGDLTLGPREGGGSVAELRLPQEMMA